MFDLLTATERTELRERMLRSVVASSKLARYSVNYADLHDGPFQVMSEALHLHGELFEYDYGKRG